MGESLNTIHIKKDRSYDKSKLYPYDDCKPFRTLIFKLREDSNYYNSVILTSPLCNVVIASPSQLT
jgi:hypothetical protein